MSCFLHDPDSVPFCLVYAPFMSWWYPVSVNLPRTGVFST